MQLQQMADSFFGFDTSLGAALDDGLDCLEDEDLEENYDALNDETFGSEANTGDWEQDHEKLAQITESSRPRYRNDNSKSESEIDVEKSLSHLVLDEKEVTIPRPGVWDSPNFAIPPTQIVKPSLSALKNACTVEELERGLITNRPPPGLVKPPGSPHQPPASTSAQNLFLNSITSAEKLHQTNGTGPTQNQFSLIAPILKLPPPQHLNLQNVRSIPNAPGNVLRYSLPLPHLIIPPGQRQPSLHGNFSFHNFPPTGNSGMGPLPFGMRPDHPLIPPYPNNQQQMNQHMHMANQRNQNKQFNDRSDNHHQPFFRNNQFHHQNYNHMNRFFGNQGFGHPMHQVIHHPGHIMSNGIGPSGELDEYAGLMNNREKQWLNNIQLLQLNTNQPYIDDYYYTVFCDRQNKKNEIKNLNKNRKMNNNKGNGNNNNNGFHKDPRDNKEQSTFTKATTPMQFENSLGKLQYSSVTAPRKIIDMDVVPNSDPQQASTIQQKDTKKTRQLLLEIERLYLLLLKLEDKTNPLAIIAEQQREQQQREQLLQQHQESGEPLPELERRDLVKEKEELTVSIMTSLLQLAQDDKLTSLLSIRKGKTLFLRFLPFMNTKEYRDKLTELWRAVIKGLAVIGRRDSNVLTNYYAEFYKWAEENCIKPFAITNNWSIWIPMASLVIEFIESTNQPSKTNSIAFALSSKFGISVLALLIKYGRQISPLNSTKWDQFLKAIAESIGSSSPVVSPCEILDKKVLESHLRSSLIVSPQHLAAFELFFTEANPTR
ncbi:protein PAT1 homolog 1 [Phymastichus coffea]|uniref:protein PAT1 homolog 1 n=1 Tax=Phymastichus coffea TaxID=108790 RepID=UPI00273B1C8B|nr:protein PAT1 homolog 1 [Phymastichus coffea]